MQQQGPPGAVGNQGLPGQPGLQGLPGKTVSALCKFVW